ncbi:Molecular chaperones (DnaJ family) [Giardia duodenalis]|uniref:Molecular chaperones (DnaJ family) n=1 Tax=Giardia intestinalis TaxID=5741 RepID=V6TLJ3_GIAIN|nr:Molecular chaperones (DnaJ family) [Giardia intestinalis]
MGTKSKKIQNTETVVEQRGSTQQKKTEANFIGGPSTSKQEPHNKPKRMQEIPVQQFRGLDPLYDSYVRNPSGEQVVEPEDSSDLEMSTEGYLVQIPFAPGSEPCTGPNDPNYRKLKQKDVTLGDLQTPRRHPIIIFDSPNDLLDFLHRFNRFHIPEDNLNLLLKEIEFVVERGGDCRLMPDGRFVMYTREIEEMISKRRDMAGKISTEHIQLRKLCFYFFALLLLSAIVIGGLAFIMNFLFPSLFKFGSSSSESLSPEEKMRESYKALDLAPDSSVEEIKKQYKKLAVKWHPDRNPNCVDCEAKFMVIADAYKALLDILAGGDGEPTQQREGSDPDREFVVRPMRYR